MPKLRSAKPTCHRTGDALSRASIEQAQRVDCYTNPVLNNLFHDLYSKKGLPDFACFCYAAHMLCYAASVAIIQDVRLCFLLRGPHALLRRECCKHTLFSVSLHFGAGRVFFLVTRPPFFNENHLWGPLIHARDNKQGA